MLFTLEIITKISCRVVQFIQCSYLLAQVSKENVIKTKYNSAYMQVYKFTFYN